MTATQRDWQTAVAAGANDIIDGLKSILLVENDPYRPLRIAAVCASLVVVAVNITFYGGHGGLIGLLVGAVVAIVNIAMPSSIYRGFSMKLLTFPIISCFIWIVALALSVTAGMGIIGGPVAAMLEGESGFSKAQQIRESRLAEGSAIAKPAESAAALKAKIDGVLAETVEYKGGWRSVGKLTNGGKTCATPLVVVADQCAKIAELNAKYAQAQAYEKAEAQRRADEEAVIGGIKEGQSEAPSAFTEAYSVWAPFLSGDKVSAYRIIMTVLVVFVDLMASILPWGLQQARAHATGSGSRQLTSADLRELLMRPDLSDADRRRYEMELARLEMIENDVARLEASRRATTRLLKF